MMRRGLVVLACVAAGLAGGCRRQAVEPAAAQGAPRASGSVASIDPADAAFGYTDDTGTKLLMLDDGVAMEAARAKAMEIAVCSNSRQIPIRYLQFQKRAAQSNGRQSAWNLKYDEGHLYEIAGVPADPGDTCLLVTASYLRQFPVAVNSFSMELRNARESEYQRKSNEADASGKPLDMTQFQATGAFVQASIARLRSEKGRSVTSYWLLHGVGESQQVAAVEFDAVGDSLLGSLVLAESGRLSSFDMPANRKALESRGGCWRIDDECQFNERGMDVPAAMGAPGEQLVFFTSWGQEGQIARLLQARGGKLVQVLGASRYHLPV
jgi:hypothetical protein